MVLDRYGHFGGGLLRACAGAGGSDDRRRNHHGGRARCDRYFFVRIAFLLSFSIRQGVTRDVPRVCEPASVSRSAAASEFEFEQQPCALAGKIRQVESRYDADFTAGDLRLPRRAHQHLGGYFPEKVGPR